MNIRILSIIDFNNQIASKEGYHLYYYNTEELGDNCFIAYTYRNEQEEKGLKTAWGETKEEAINKLNQ